MEKKQACQAAPEENRKNTAEIIFLMKVFVTGVSGQLGYDVICELNRRGYTAVGSDVVRPTWLDDVSDGATEKSGNRGKQEPDTGHTASCAPSSGSFILADITNEQEIKKVIADIKPDAIVHCAAWTAVDAAEEEENKAKVDRINHLGTKYIAEAAKEAGAKMLYLSTDYVFDGKGEEPWKPDCKNYAPLNVYGQSKLDGELEVAKLLEKFFIVRIAWVFGLNGKNFIRTMVNVGKTHDSVRVVNDQIGTPTYTHDLARLLVDMIGTEKYGYYHATNAENGDYISWYDFTKEIYRQYGLETKVCPVTTAEYGLSKAARPFNSRLDKSKLEENGFKPLPDWKDALGRYLLEADL